MNIERYLRLMAGSLVLISIALVVFVSPWFMLLTGFVGMNLFIAGAFGWCPGVSILRKIGVPETVKSSSSCGCY